MNEGQVRGLYAQCKRVARLTALAANMLGEAIKLYRCSTISRERLKEVINLSADHLATIQNELIPHGIDWPVIESLEVRKGSRKASVAKSVLMLPGHIVLTRDDAMKSPDAVFDGFDVELLSQMVKASSSPLVEFDLESEEGKAITWVRNHTSEVVTGHLGLIVDYTRRTVRRERCESSIDMANKTAAWPLFVALFEAAGTPLTTAKIRDFGQDAMALRKNKQTVKEDLTSVGITVSGNRSHNWILTEDLLET